MGNRTGGRRHITNAWSDMAAVSGTLASGRKLVVQMIRSQSKHGPGFVPELDAVKIGQKAGMAEPPIMINGDDVTHVVTEQGIAYLYQAESIEERKKMLACISQGTPLGSLVNFTEVDFYRRRGKVAYPQDLGISPDAANKDLLAAKSLQEIADISGGLYEIPERFRS